MERISNWRSQSPTDLTDGTDFKLEKSNSHRFNGLNRFQFGEVKLTQLNRSADLRKDFRHDIREFVFLEKINTLSGSDTRAVYPEQLTEGPAGQYIGGCPKTVQLGAWLVLTLEMDLEPVHVTLYFGIGVIAVGGGGGKA